MATVQQQAPVAQNDKHNAAVEEMTKEAQSLLTKSINEGKLERQACIVAGAMNAMNAATLPMKLDKKHDYDGKFVVNPSENIEPGHPGVFVHQGKLFGPERPIGSSKGAVVYTEKDIPHVMMRKSYLLAWDVPKNLTHIFPKNKVYVECGRAGTFDNVDWADIDMKLKASSFNSRYIDPTSMAYITATVDAVGDEAKLGAIFSKLNPGQLTNKA